VALPRENQATSESHVRALDTKLSLAAIIWRRRFGYSRNPWFRSENTESHLVSSSRVVAAKQPRQLHERNRPISLNRARVTRT